MTKKQILTAYQNLSDSEKVERLEFWAERYLDYLALHPLGTLKEALMSDCVVHYERTKKEHENE